MRPLVPLVLLAACSAPPEASPDGGAPPLLEAPPAGAGVQLGMDVHIGAGEETQRCQYIVVDDAMSIAKFEHAYTTGSHHILLYQTSLDPASTSTAPFECTTKALTDLGVTGIAYGAQSPDGELAYPDGVALDVPARSVLLLQAHYLNASDQDLDAQVRVNLWFATTPVTQEAGTLFFYDFAIVVPAGQPASATMHCALPDDVNLVFGQSHMHKRGVGYTATLDDGTVLYQTDRWEGVEPRRYAPPLHVAAGSSIDYTCDYQGDADRTVVQGPSADANEMCMYIASYYPKTDAATELCAGAGSGPRFTGTQTCAEAVGCYRNATDPVAQQECLTDTCAAASQPADDLFHCMYYQCSSECAQLGSVCDGCVLDKCAPEYQACTQSSC